MSELTKSKFTQERERCQEERAERVGQMEREKGTHDNNESLRASTADDTTDN